MTGQCVREHEVVAAVASGRWADALRSHLSQCEICRDVRDVANALRTEYAADSQKARVPSAGLVWWRAELRVRREAMRAAERPLTLAHAFGGASAIGVIAALLNQMSPWFRQAAIPLLEQHFYITLSVALLAVLAPVALYFVLSDK